MPAHCSSLYGHQRFTMRWKNSPLKEFSAGRCKSHFGGFRPIHGMSPTFCTVAPLIYVDFREKMSGTQPVVPSEAVVMPQEPRFSTGMSRPMHISIFRQEVTWQ